MTNVQKENRYNILLCATHYYVQHFTVSGTMVCARLFLIYTSLTFRCLHAALGVMRRFE